MTNICIYIKNIEFYGLITIISISEKYIRKTQKLSNIPPKNFS